MSKYDKYKESAFTHEEMQPMIIETDMTDVFDDLAKAFKAGHDAGRSEAADEIERLREACKNASSYISVRDQFAMAALPVAAKAEGRLLSDDIARMAYELADSMIKTRAALGEKE